MTKEKGYYEKEGVKLREDVQKLEEKQASGEEVESWTLKNAVRHRIIRSLSSSNVCILSTANNNDSSCNYL